MYSSSVFLGCLIKLLLDKTEVLSNNEGLSYDHSASCFCVFVCQFGGSAFGICISVSICLFIISSHFLSLFSSLASNTF